MDAQRATLSKRVYAHPRRLEPTTKQETAMENTEKLTLREKLLAAGFIALILFAEPIVDAFFSAFGL